MQSVRFYILALYKKYRVFILFLIADFILNLIQALRTEITDTEAYLQITYADYLDWGYTEYPPAIGIAIKLGTLLLGKNILGVRIISVILGTLIKIILWNLILKATHHKNQTNFIIIYYSIIIFSFCGFMINPYVLLTFFFTLSVFLYSRLLKSNSFKHSLLLGLAWAGMLYSRYEGVVIIILFLISNKAFFTKQKFALVIFSTLILYTPHLMWLYDNNYVSLQLPWFTSNTKLNLWSTITFVSSLLFLIGPIIILILFFGLTKNKQHTQTNNPIQRIVLFMTMGLSIFFLIKSLLSPLKSYLIVSVYCPLLFISCYNLFNRNKIPSLLRINFIVCLFIQIAMRLYLIYHPLFWQYDFNKVKKEVFFLAEISPTANVIFINSKYHTSKYNFYTHSNASNIETYNYRPHTQYDKILSASQYNNKSVTIFTENKISPLWDTIFYKDKYIYYRYIDTFRYFGNSKITNIKQQILTEQNTASLQLSFRLTLPPDLKNIPLNKIQIDLLACKDLKIIDTIHLDSMTKNSNYTNVFQISTIIPLQQINTIISQYSDPTFTLSILQDGDILYFNSTYFKITQ